MDILPIKTIQERLNIHGIKVDIDGVNGIQTENAILLFQKTNNLYADGIVGKITATKLLENPIIKSLTTEKIKYVKITCDKYGEGYNSTSLREDVAKAFNCVIDEVHQAGGIITSSGGRRALNESVGANRSSTSLHYVGRAQDLFVYSGMVDPLKDPYVIIRDNKEKNKWIVFARAKNASKIKLSAYTYKHQEIEVEDNFINLTDLFKKYGFERISARSVFFKNAPKRNDLASEWWHFQWEIGLIPNKTTFGEELLKIYDIKELEKYSLWNYKNFTWKKDWF